MNWFSPRELKGNTSAVGRAPSLPPITWKLRNLFLIYHARCYIVIYLLLFVVVVVICCGYKTTDYAVLVNKTAETCVYFNSVYSVTQVSNKLSSKSPFP